VKECAGIEAAGDYPAPENDQRRQPGPQRKAIKEQCLAMHGQGTFYDPRLNDTDKFPIAAANGFADVRSTPDLITSKLADLRFYQLAIPAPAPNDKAQRRGGAVRVRRIGSIQPRLGAQPSSGAATSTAAEVNLVRIAIRCFSLSHRSYLVFRYRREFRIDSMGSIIIGER
jgi:hypothetical protein